MVAGDCRAVLGSIHIGSVATNATAVISTAAAPRVTALSRDHNAKLSAEQARLAAEHPGEPDIVVCKRERVCYVKGRLQPTRSV
jgi:hypothetical protein